MDWQGLGVGIAFYLILEGILPLFNPKGLKQTLIHLLEMNENSLRTIGALSIILGVVMLYSIK